MTRYELPLNNAGMSRDMSVSKDSGGFAFENRNVRILSGRHDTRLSVTSERGNRPVDGMWFDGTLIGWNVLNNYVILFLTGAAGDGPDNIWRITYTPTATGDTAQWRKTLIYCGDLGFDTSHPIESVVDYETEEIQKIYWVDGIHVLRYLDFADAYLERHLVDGSSLDDERPEFDFAGQDDWFNTNRAADNIPTVEITCSQDGNSRANGVVQYFITYYDKNGSESNWVWCSPLVYLSPDGRGGSPDETCTTTVMLKVTGLDTTFDYVRLYSVELSSQGGTRVVYIVAEATTEYGEATLVDDGKPLSTEDASSILYLGSRGVKAGTMAHKDGVLFLGDITIEQNTGIEGIEDGLKEAVNDKTGYRTDGALEFYLTEKESDSIPLPDLTGLYPYESQLQYPNSRITTFKGNEKYRFAVRFRRPDGATTSAFWIGDKVNDKYPKAVDGYVMRPLVSFTLPQAIVGKAVSMGYTYAQLMRAEATYSDRSVKAQGILSPTMFNVWERYNEREYAISSWCYRPRRSSFAWKHFEPVHNSTDPTGEIQCNWWDDSKYDEDAMPTPYYKTDSGGNVADPLEGTDVGEAWIMLWRVHNAGAQGGSAYVCFFEAEATDSASATLPDLSTVKAWGVVMDDWLEYSVKHATHLNRSAIAIVNGYIIYATTADSGGHHHWKKTYDKVYDKLIDRGVPARYLIDYDTFGTMEPSRSEKTRWYSYQTIGGASATNAEQALASAEWTAFGDIVSADYGTNKYVASAYKKHLMFVDENIVTLNSPELEQEAVNVDDAGLKLRVVGVARVVGNITDYAADITGGKYAGSTLYTMSFNNQCVSYAPDGLQSWPLWIEHGPIKKSGTDEDELDDVDQYFLSGATAVRWWLHMFQKSGGLSALPKTSDGDDAATTDLINSKTFANLRYCAPSVYASDGNMLVYDTSGSKHVRQYDYLSSQLADIGDGYVYNANVNDIINMPGTAKYPVLYSDLTDTDGLPSFSYYISDPVRLTYRSRAHAVINLGTSYTEYRLLPWVNDDERFENTNGGLLPWVDNGWKDNGSSFNVAQDKLLMPEYTNEARNKTSRYLLIGELFREYADGEDTRYGGVTESAVEACTFIPAGQFTDITETNVLIGDEGDTYFQRWDGVKTVPMGDDDTNSVIDIASAMVETHINMDGRYDKDRGSTRLTDIDIDSFGQVNPVYSQADDFVSAADLDEQADLDSWRSYVTWTLEKHDAAETDEWTHVTLASTLKLDGDRGICRALRRTDNMLVAFQDRAICEILFNSRTQMNTMDGVPVELANTGKVDGKRYITTTYGTTNKWGVAEGKNGLYFIDDLNQLIVSIAGNQVGPLSTKARLDAWTKLRTDEAGGEESWRPDIEGKQFLAQYDRLRSEVYFFKWNDSDFPCLVYNEELGCFTSFYDYLNVPMLSNIGDRLISYRDNRLWLQNEGLFCNFFGKGYTLSLTYRAVAAADATWTNLAFRSDFHTLVDADGNATSDVDGIIDGTQDALDTYVPDETFDTIEVWDEYQRTGEVKVKWRPNLGETYPDVRKKFRLWRMDVPRAIGGYGLDRMRNPWVYLRLRKAYTDGRDMMHLHSLSMTYWTTQKAQTNG